MYLARSSFNKYNAYFTIAERLEISILIDLWNGGYLLLVLSRYLTSTRDDCNIMLLRECK